MNTIGLVLTIIGVILSAYAVKLQFFSKPKEELQHLRIQFRATQRLSKQVQEDLEILINCYNMGDCIIFPGTTYCNYLESMKKSYNENLSDDLIKNIEALDVSKSNLLSMTKSL